MPRLLTVTLLVPLLALAHTLAAPVPKHSTKDDDSLCCPTRVGDRLVHTLDDGREVVEVVTKVEKTEAGTRVTFEWIEPDGSHTYDKTVVATARGFQVVEYTGQKLNPPMWDLKLPNEDSNRWTETWKLGDQIWHLETVGWEEVTVPAGTFRAIRVERREESDELGVVTGQTTYWYAPGIGCIKWSSGNQFRELKSFTHDK
jgi:hypothetical protein